jgi:hypothetical protein
VSRARLVVEQGHLAEDRSGAEDRQDDLAAVFSRQDDLHLALGYEVERVPPVALDKDQAAPVHRFLPEYARKCPQLLLRQTREERDPAEDFEGRQRHGMEI